MADCSLSASLLFSVALCVFVFFSFPSLSLSPFSHFPFFTPTPSAALFSSPVQEIFCIFRSGKNRSHVHRFSVFRVFSRMSRFSFVTAIVIHSV